MANDASAEGGPGGPGALEPEAVAASVEDLVAASVAEVVAGFRAGAEAGELVEARPGQGVDPRHQVGPPGQGHENQVPGGDLSLLLAHQGI